MKSSPEEIRISHSAESVETQSIEQYLTDLEEDLKEEIERIAKEEPMLGEGKAAEVFTVNHMRRSKCDACIKIWRPELQKLRVQSPIAYAEIQTMEPEEEFNLQDELYMKGFKKIPRPLAYTEINGLHAMAMERIPGYTLKELEEKGVTITNPTWQELERMLFDLTINKGVVHRDLHKGNIMLKTTDDISKQKTVSGELYFIDFGLSKRIFGGPTPEDFELTIGRDTVKYTEDIKRVEQLKPNRRSSTNVFIH